jgi:hypothetical protein
MESVPPAIRPLRNDESDAIGRLEVRVEGRKVRGER